MLVILRENVANLGVVGDVVKVSDGYARNFLLPRNLVVTADEKNVMAIEHHKRLLEKKRLALRSQAQELAQKLSGFSCSLSRKVGEHEKLFGSVTVSDIADCLSKAGYVLDRRTILLEAPIKTLGEHSVEVRLEPEISAQIKVSVVKEG